MLHAGPPKERLRLLLEVLDECDNERTLCKQHRGHPCYDGHRLLRESHLKIGFRHKIGRVQLLERVGDALGLCPREAALFEFLDDAVVSMTNVCIYRQYTSGVVACKNRHFGVVIRRTVGSAPQVKRLGTSHEEAGVHGACRWGSTHATGRCGLD